MHSLSSSTESDEEVSSRAAAPAFATTVRLVYSKKKLEEDVVGDVILEPQATPSSPTVHEKGFLGSR